METPLDAFTKEIQAFNLFRDRLNGEVFVSPRGSDAGFPDFGITVNGVHVYVEYKADWNAQMSGLSSWYYKSRTFYSNVATDEAVRIINLMRRSGELKASAQNMVETVKNVRGVSRGAIVGSMALGENKRALVEKFDEAIAGNKVLGRVISPLVARTILDVYKAKYQKNKQPGSKHLFLMMIDDKIWVMAEEGLVGNDKIGILQLLTDGKVAPYKLRLNRFALRDCYLEVRVSPRNTGRLDTRALMNLNSARSIVYSGLAL